MTARDVETLLDVQRRSYAGAGAGVRGSWPEKDSMGREELEAFLTERRYAVLATARPDGRAHASPVAFTVEQQAFWIATVAGLRLRNLRVNPWGSLVVLEGQEGDHRALTVEGPAGLHEGTELTAARARLDGAWLERHGLLPDWAVALIELRPERLFSYATPERA